MTGYIFQLPSSVSDRLTQLFTSKEPIFSSTCKMYDGNKRIRNKLFWEPQDTLPHMFILMLI
jgi:hypothetical protein